MIHSGLLLLSLLWRMDRPLPAETATKRVAYRCVVWRAAEGEVGVEIGRHGLRTVGVDRHASPEVPVFSDARL